MDSWETTGWDAGGLGRSEEKCNIFEKLLISKVSLWAFVSGIYLTYNTEGDGVLSRTCSVAYNDCVGACVLWISMKDLHTAMIWRGPD